MELKQYKNGVWNKITTLQTPKTGIYSKYMNKWLRNTDFIDINNTILVITGVNSQIYNDTDVNVTVNIIEGS